MSEATTLPSLLTVGCCVQDPHRRDTVGHIRTPDASPIHTPAPDPQPPEAFTAASVHSTQRWHPWPVLGGCRTFRTSCLLGPAPTEFRVLSYSTQIRSSNAVDRCFSLLATRCLPLIVSNQCITLRHCLFTSTRALSDKQSPPGSHHQAVTTSHHQAVTTTSHYNADSLCLSSPIGARRIGGAGDADQCGARGWGCDTASDSPVLATQASCQVEKQSWSAPSYRQQQSSTASE